MNSENEVVLKVENLEKTYRTESENLTVFKNLSMEVLKGQKCVIIGKSGSGKSTLLNIIGGLDSATEGSVFVDGKKISSMSERELVQFRKNTLGLVFQFHYLLKDFSALENIMIPSLMAGTPRKIAKEKAFSLLSDVGLADRADHFPSQLSGGERQRVSVARSLINDPSLILADEPTGNLDPQNALMIGSMLFNLSDKYRKTLLLVTHDMNIASSGDVRYSIKDGMLLRV